MATSDNIGERIEIENVGKIKSANIKLNGLTIIAGINDTGKSTVGKMMFSIVKAISRFEQDLIESKEKLIRHKIDKLYFILRRADSHAEFDLIKDSFYPLRFFNDIKYYINNYHTYFQESLFGGASEDKKIIDHIFNQKNMILNTLPEPLKTDSNNLLNDIKINLLLKTNKEDKIKRALKRVLYSEFQSEITPIGTLAKSIIRYFAGSQEILNIGISRNEIASLALSDDLMFKDTVYLETPLLIHMYDLIKATGTKYDNDKNDISNRSPKVPLHVKDLILKINNAKYYYEVKTESDFIFSKTLEKISSIIKGGFLFDIDKNELIFAQKANKEGENIEIRPINTASGIKSFGIIQLLLQANIINDRCLLIIDEPENHLHPQWQVEYAKMIIELVQNDIYIIINSHSPYMIQALKYYSEKAGIQEKVNYYMSEIDETDNQAIIKDVTDDLNVIFRTLAEPFKNLVWQ